MSGKDNDERDGAKGVPANWEFVNFNPVMFGRRNLPPGLDEMSDEEAVRRRPRSSPPPSRPPSWLAALPHHCLLEDQDPGNHPVPRGLLILCSLSRQSFVLCLTEVPLPLIPPTSWLAGLPLHGILEAQAPTTVFSRTQT